MSEQSTHPAISTDLTIDVDIAAPPEAVFDHLVAPEKVLRWLAHDGDLDVRPGGGHRLQMAPGVVARGQYLEISPPHCVVFSWGWDGSDDVPPGSTTVRIELTPTDDGGTHVQLTHSGLPEGAGDDHGDGWRYFTRRLLTVAEGGDPGPIDLAAISADEQTGEAT